jgi:MYXO-CTERM domain-containing protein
LVVSGTDQFTWPIPANSGLPANLQVLQYSTSGPGEVIQDNFSTLPDLIGQVPIQMPTSIPGTGGSTGGNLHHGLTTLLGDGSIDASTTDAGPSAHSHSNGVTSSGACGCSMPGQSTHLPFSSLMSLSVLGLFALRRRRN